MRVVKRSGRTACASALALLLAACAAVGPEYQRPALDLPATFSNTGAAGTIAIPANWWTLYGDATLNGLPSGQTVQVQVVAVGAAPQSLVSPASATLQIVVP